MKYNNYPKVIEIQFHNKCNSNCLICPYKDMHYNYPNMDDELFNKFLSEIDENKLVRLIPYLNNEPFLDRDYVKKVAIIREKFPKLEIEISSNASMIKESDLSALSKLNITELRLSVFGYYDKTYHLMMPNLNKEKVFKNLELISKYFKDTNTIVSIVMIDNNEIDEEEFILMKKLCDSLGFVSERWGYLDRSNNVSYKSNNIDNPNVCTCEQNRPLERMHILSNGDVILCCQDWRHEYVVGNIRNNTISEVWNSSLYNSVRDSLYDPSLESPTICQKCKLGH